MENSTCYFKVIISNFTTWSRDSLISLYFQVLACMDWMTYDRVLVSRILFIYGGGDVGSREIDEGVQGAQ